MPASGEENEFVSHVLDLMQSLGRVRARRMFGGYGIFIDGLMFALIADETLYLKADEESANAVQDKGTGSVFLSQARQAILDVIFPGA